jgi:hypothetical protein
VKHRDNFTLPQYQRTAYLKHYSGYTTYIDVHNILIQIMATSNSVKTATLFRYWQARTRMRQDTFVYLVEFNDSSLLMYMSIAQGQFQIKNFNKNLMLR